MGFFDFLKTKKTVEPKITISFTETIDGKVCELTEQDNTEPLTDFEHLSPDGGLPWGWISRNKDFIDKVETEYNYFWEMWFKASNSSPRELYQALKSFVLYLEDIEKICKKKGECFTFWLYEILTSYDYLSKRKEELEELTANMDILQKEYEKRRYQEEQNQIKIAQMKPDVILLLKENDGILHSDFWKLFDDEIDRDAATDIVYNLLKEGKIERTKSGRSFILHYNC